MSGQDADRSSIPFRRGPLATTIGFAMCRVVVPLWVLTGAAFKLYERTPSTLPSQFNDTAKDLGIGLGFLLRGLIGLELLAVVTMIAITRFARPMAIFMLSCFCLILINELRRSATSCGCFGGAVSIRPGVVLGIDGALLALTIFFAPTRSTRLACSRGVLITAVLAIIAGFGAAFGVPEKTPEPVLIENDDPPPQQPELPPCQRMAEVIPAKAWWYVDKGKMAAWTGECWNQIDLFRHLSSIWPADMGRGRKTVVFYRRDCDHCENMFKTYFRGAVKNDVIAYEIPSEEPFWSPSETKNVRLFEHGTAMELIIETPLVIVLDDGIVIDAVEGLGFERLLED